MTVFNKWIPTSFSNETLNTINTRHIFHNNLNDIVSHNQRMNSVRNHIFDSNTVVCKLLLDIMVIMTFGLASPLLAMAVAVDACSVYIVWRVLIGRYMSMVLCGEGDEVLKASARVKLEEASKQASDGVRESLWMAVWFASVFWSLFVFDMMSDVYGYLVGGAMIVVPLVGLPVYYFVLTRRTVLFGCFNFGHSSSREGIEMTSQNLGVVTINPILVERSLSHNSEFYDLKT